MIVQVGEQNPTLVIHKSTGLTDKIKKLRPHTRELPVPMEVDLQVLEQVFL